jgi:hypothetical protein
VRATWSDSAPPDTAGLETPLLEAADGGQVALVALGASVDTLHPILLTFGHRAERARWMVPSDRSEMHTVLGALERHARHGRFRPPPDLGYINPTNRAATPDRDPGSVPPAYPRRLLDRRVGGEVWASFEIGRDGAALPGSLRVLWTDQPELATAVREVLASYRYPRRDAARIPPRLRVYQRFRFTAR